MSLLFLSYIQLFSLFALTIQRSNTCCKPSRAQLSLMQLLYAIRHLARTQPSLRKSIFQQAVVGIRQRCRDDAHLLDIDWIVW